MVRSFSDADASSGAFCRYSEISKQSSVAMTAHFTNAVGGRDGQIEMFLDVVKPNHPGAIFGFTESAFDHKIGNAVNLVTKNLPCLRQVGGISGIEGTFGTDKDSVILTLTEDEKTVFSLTVIIGFFGIVSDEIIIVQEPFAEPSELFLVECHHSDNVGIGDFGRACFALKSCFEVHV